MSDQANDKVKADLMRQLGIDRLPPEKQAEAFDRIGAILFQKVLLRCIEELEEKDQQEMDRMLQENPENGAAIFSFLKERIPNFEEIMSEEAQDFRDDALKVMEGIK